MDSFKVLVVEDDRFTRRVVELIVTNHFPEMEVVGRCGSLGEALRLIQESKPDLVILDIQLEDGNAFELLEQLKPIPFKVLFMSSYQSYMEESVQFAAVDFIQKPFDESDFVMALDKALDTFTDAEYAQRLDVLFSNIVGTPGNRSLVMATENGTRIIPVRDIEYGESITGGSLFSMTNGEVLKVSRPLRRFESLLAATGFFRCHPLFLINLSLIIRIDVDIQQVMFVSGHAAPFESRRTEALIKRYNELHSAR